MTKRHLQQQDWARQSRTALSPEQVQQQLGALPGWQLDTSASTPAITCSYEFVNFYETMAFVNALALIAHQQDHHPDLAVSYGRCTVRLNTHDVGGISATDIDCARRIQALLPA